LITVQTSKLIIYVAVGATSPLNKIGLGLIYIESLNAALSHRMS
jgi:hypothetical protein